MTYEGEEMREIKPRHLAVKLNISETHVRHLLRMGSWHHPAGTAYAWDEGEEEREVLAYLREMLGRSPKYYQLVDEVIAFFGSVTETAVATNYSSSSINQARRGITSHDLAWAIEKATSGKFRAGDLLALSSNEKVVRLKQKRA